MRRAQWAYYVCQEAVDDRTALEDHMLAMLHRFGRACAALSGVLLFSYWDEFSMN